MKTLSIGDIHGRDSWKFITHGSSYEYEIWKIACENGAEGTSSIWAHMPFMGIDKIIFIGDYVDSFTVKNPEMLQNLRDIIYFKKTCPDKVVLLLGNHDIQYIIDGQICSGYRSEMNFDFNQEFSKNIGDFQMAYQKENYLWTHAGVTSKWLEGLENDLTQHPRYNLVFSKNPPITIADKINAAWVLRIESIYAVDRESGGWDQWAGPIWVRPKTLNKYAINNVHQIVGHTPQKNIHIENIDSSMHHYIDVLEYGSSEGLYLEI